MEKKHSSTCEKIFKALTISPSFRTIRRISHNPQHPMPSPNPSKPVKPLKTPRNRDGVEVFPIKFDNSTLPPHPNEKLKSTTTPAPIKEATSQIIPVHKKPDTTVPLPSQHQWREHGDDKFSDYINRAKPKITATTSNVGDRKNDDHFSNYINRVKHKIKNISSFVGGRSDSFK